MVDMDTGSYMDVDDPNDDLKHKGPGKGGAPNPNEVPSSDIGGTPVNAISADLLIMMAIDDMNSALTAKTTQDADLGSTLAGVEGKYMSYMTDSSNSGVPGTLAYDLAQIQAAGSGPNMNMANQQFSLDQTKISTTDNLIKSVENTATTAASSDNTNMSNFMNFTNGVIQSMQFTVRLLQNNV